MMNTRPALKELGLGTGKKARLHRILHEHGVRNGTAIFLPYDHGLEHGPRDFSGHPESADPRHLIRLAVEGGFNGIAIQIGLARKFYWEYAGEVPLVLKLNGKTDIPAAAAPVSPLNATVEEAVRPTGRCCWSRAARRPATRPCWRRRASRWRPAPPASSSAATSSSVTTTSHSVSSPS